MYRSTGIGFAGACIILVSLLEGAYAYSCPYDYPFYSCPRLGDPSYLTTCCQINGYYQCCDTTVLAAWAIGVIAVICILVSSVVLLICCACCPCCWMASRRRRSNYVVVTQEAGPPPTYPVSGTTTTTVYGYSAQPNYNTAGYPQASAPLMSGTVPNTTYVKQ